MARDFQADASIGAPGVSGPEASSSTDQENLIRVSSMMQGFRQPFYRQPKWVQLCLLQAEKTEHPDNVTKDPIS